MKSKPPQTRKKTSARAARPVRAAASSTAPAADYAAWLGALKTRVRSAQLQAAARVNHELLRLYWDIGRTIDLAQKRAGWGASLIPRLAADLQSDFPKLKGFSERNLGRMVAFQREYPGLFTILPQAAAKSSDPTNHAILPPLVAKSVRRSKVQRPAAQIAADLASALIVPQAVAQSDRTSPAASILPPLVAKLPWAHHVILLEKVKNLDERLWYMRAAVEHGWSRAVLTEQIHQRAHARAGRAVTNFAATLPPPQSDLAQQTLQDPYVFDFLALGPAARERDLEQGLADHIQKFLVALGAGFAFVGRQVRLEVGGEDYALDLLFYHLRLRCYVVIDLKMEAFRPEFAGKMNFYLSAVDDRFRHRDDQPSIGLLLCREKHRLTVEYALRDLKKPIGVSEWRTRLVESLPKELRGSLPTVEELEAELGVRRPGKKGKR